MSETVYRHNVMKINTPDAFFSVKGRLANGVRDVYFIRMVGENTSFISEISVWESRMKVEGKCGNTAYFRFWELPNGIRPEKVSIYTEMYREWKEDNCVHTGKNNAEFDKAVNNACKIIVNCYKKEKNNATETMVKDLVIKVFSWLDLIDADILKSWSPQSVIKIVADNITKEKQYLFFLFLTYLGCDVMLIQNRTDVMFACDFLAYSAGIIIGPYGKEKLLEFSCLPVKPVEKKKVLVPKHQEKKPKVRSEMSFEALAQLASSIVLVLVHDENGEVTGTGSGIMIGGSGYILTNNHVVQHGSFFSVRIEEDEEIYQTDSLIKYNSSTDLALIRIDRKLNPIPIYDGKKELVRGQKVVAIGSPLGLFNSVSDGIISGFRNINDVDMIQFTAPISRGSSGGAVMNMYGEVIGISTAGFDSGQNINLAVGYESIRLFAGSFIGK